jgi:hypothetical protein
VLPVIAQKEDFGVRCVFGVLSVQRKGAKEGIIGTGEERRERRTSCTSGETRRQKRGKEPRRAKEKEETIYETRPMRGQKKGEIRV